MIEVSLPVVMAFCAVIGSVAIVLGFWWRFSGLITECKLTANAATILAAALQVKIETTQRELNDYKVTVAGAYASNGDLMQAEQRFSGLAEEIKRDIRGVTERLDRVLQQTGN